MPIFSIIVTCYNRIQYLEEALDAVLDQTVSSFEVIVVDDGSDTNAAETISTLCKKDDRIVLIKNSTNTGVSSARNKALANAKGEFISFLDDDDQLAPTFLQLALDSFKQQPNIDVALCQSSVDSKSEKSFFRYHTLKETLRSQPLKRTYETSHASLLYQFPPQINAMVFRKRIFQDHQFDTSLKIGEDIYLWFKLLAAGIQFGKKQSNQPHALIRVHGDVQLSATDNQQVLDFQHRLKADFHFPDPSLETLIDFKLFMRFALVGNLKRALQMLLQSMKHPGYFLRIASSQGWLKFRILISYTLYKIMKIDW
ncbi:MAG: glycosyltransferase family 2 protein [Cytophagales bacterium]|nr:glycosyltransferase family 2 protein [Cytophagales bacterium]